MAQEKSLRIELTRKVMIGNKLYNKGSVIESDEPTLVAEYQGVINSGYGRKSTKALSDGTVDVAAFDAAGIVDGTVADVTERLSGLNADQLAAVGKAEDARDTPRAGVHKAIEAATAALAPPAE